MMGDYQRQLVSMIEEFLSPATPNTKRVLLGKEIGNFSQQSSECLTILATTYPNSPINRHLIMFTLATIESSIKKVAVGDERRMEFFTTHVCAPPHTIRVAAAHNVYAARNTIFGTEIFV